MSDAFTDSRRKAEKRGRRSETYAVLLLMLKGYRILGRRVKTPMGEIDLIATSPRGITCFIEVKARASDGAALESVGLRQQARIARAASLYVAKRPILTRHGVRFDVVTVAPWSLPRHRPDAFRSLD